MQGRGQSHRGYLERTQKGQRSSSESEEAMPRRKIWSAMMEQKWRIRRAQVALEGIFSSLASGGQRMLIHGTSWISRNVIRTKSTQSLIS
jgi:hypothetical protein